MSDDPFDSGGKTVIRPNPGGALGRKVPNAPAAPPAPQPPPAKRPLPPVDNDKTVIGGAMPPGGGRVAPAMPGAGPAAGGGDDWLRGPDPRNTFFPEKKEAPKPIDASQKIPLEVALNAEQYRDLKGSNPITTAAGPLLVLLGRLRLMIIDMHAVPLMEHVAGEINDFERKVSEAGVSKHDADVAKYVLCGTADDIVQNLPGTDRHVWMQYSMLARFFQVRTSGVGFFEELNKVLANPAARYDLLELMHACLSLGFEGQFRGQAGGDAELSRIRRDVYQALRQVRARNDEDISPRWRGVALAMRRAGGALPLWAILGMAAAVLVGLFFLLRFLLGSDAGDISDEMLALHPDQQVTINRPAFTPFTGPDHGDTTQLERIREALSDDIASGGVDVTSAGEFIIVNVNNLVLFASGSADTRKEFAEVGERIAEALNKEPGPVNVTGHTDNIKLRGTGRFKSNFDLSVARAKSVSAVLSSKLDDPTRIVVEGKGKDEPIADNKTKEGRAQNRRVEITIPREETLQ